jgi:DNA helicase-2/ATP-dependent DNA helicase PcrA
MIVASLAQRHRVVICDEHQDSSGDQHSIVMALQSQGARLRVFGDPMQKIFKDRACVSACPPCDWDELTRQAQAFEQLDFPHRWTSGCPKLGQWTLAARSALKSGAAIDLRNGLPPSVTVVFAENQSQRNLEYQLTSQDRKQIDAFEQAQTSLLILTPYNDTARSFRGFFNRHIPLWEGHTRPGLEKLVNALGAAQGDRAALAAAIVAFMGEVGKGFSPSAFGNRFEKEVREGCMGNCRSKPATIQELARFLIAEANHCGVGSDRPRRFRYRRQRICGDYPPPYLCAPEASREGHQHHLQGERPRVRQRDRNALRRQEFPGQARGQMSPLRRAQPRAKPSSVSRLTQQPKSPS